VKEMSRRNYNNPAERVNDLSKYCSLKTTAQWKSFLKKWSIEWLTTKKHFSSDVRKNKWLGYNPATEEQIHSLEQRLGYLLPPSFRTFLLTTNGWRKTSTFIRQIRPISKIEWLEVDDPALLDVWEEFAEEGFNKYSGLSRKEYFSYTDRSAEAFDKSHFKTVLIISEPIQGDSAT
jgi:cell wall assembly regulator SMI1